MNAAMDWRYKDRLVKDKLNYALMNDKTQKDIVIITGRGPAETRIMAHSFMLFIGSNVFEEMLQNAKLNNEGVGEIHVPDICPASMKFILKHIYTDYIDVEQEDTINIINAALRFNLYDLAAHCVSKLEKEITTENVLKLYETANKMGDEELLNNSYLQKFILRNAVDIFQTTQFLSISAETLCKFLAFDELQIDEISLFNGVQRWGKAECARLQMEDTSENLQIVLKNIIHLIRFPLMTTQEFSSVVVPTNILSKEETIDVYFYLSMQSSNMGSELLKVKSLFCSSKRFLEPKDSKIGDFEDSASSVHIVQEHFTTNEEETKDDKQSGFGSKIIQKQELLEYLTKISGSKTISGLYVCDSCNNLNVGIETVQKMTGVYPGVLTTAMPSYLDSMEQWESFTDEIISNWNCGYLVNIVWRQEQHPLTNIEQFRTFDESKWKSLLTDGGSLNNEWKQLLDYVTPYLHRLQNAGVVTIFDILPFINCKSFLWRGHPGHNGTLTFFQITHNYLTKHHGLHSLIWTWSLSNYGDMAHLESYWPGKKFVDVASVYMGGTKTVKTDEYQKLLSVMKDKPFSMENVFSVPTSEVLVAQPRWTWFTVRDILLQNETYNNEDNVKTIFQSPMVINRNDIDFS